MSSEPSPDTETTQDTDTERLPVVREQKTNMWDVLKTTLPVLFAGVFGVIGLALILYFGVPVESIKWVLVTLCFAGPFAIAYSYLFVWKMHQLRGRYHLILDRDHQKIGLKRLDPDAHRDAEIIGNPVTRQSRAGAGEVTIHAEADQEQREQIDDNGDRDTYRQRVFISPWSGFVHPLKTLERWRSYETAREKLVPLAKSALDVRASVDTKSLEATDKVAHAVIAGAEEDSFIDGSDPFDWDHLDRNDLNDVWRTGATDHDDDDLDGELEDLDTQPHPQTHD